MNSTLQTVVTCPLITTIHSAWRSRITITCAGKRAEIIVDQIRAIARERLIKKIDHLEKFRAQDLRQLITEM